MDPLSVVAAVVGMSLVDVKLITQLCIFIDDVHNGETELQALANELVSFYASLGHVKLLITGPRHTPVSEEFKRDFMRTIRSNEAALTELQKIIDKAKKADRDRSATRVWKTVSKGKQVDALRNHMHAENELLGKMISVLAESVMVACTYQSSC